jgi:hypothetical protein
MQPHLVASRSGMKQPEPPRPFATRALLILWPAFLMAGVLEMLVFVVVDPDSLHWFGVEPLQWTRNAVYSVTFFIFWFVISTSAAITHLLESPAP